MVGSGQFRLDDTFGVGIDLWWGAGPEGWVYEAVGEW